MKDRPDRAARLQLTESMFAGHSWETAAAQSQLKISRPNICGVICPLVLSVLDIRMSVGYAVRSK